MALNYSSQSVTDQINAEVSSTERSLLTGGGSAHRDMWDAGYTHSPLLPKANEHNEYKSRKLPDSLSLQGERVPVLPPSE